MVPCKYRDPQMPEIRPIQGFRYDPARWADTSALTAPPYDVIGPDLRAKLEAASEQNIVRADLPARSGTDFTSASGGDEEGPYRKSAELLKKWIADGVLVRDKQPAIYIYTQTYTVAGKTHTRVGIISRVRLAEFSEGEILPHEQTFSGPKRDRLLLMRATGMQLSPIFGLYPDDSDSVVGPLRSALGTPALPWEQTATDVYGVVHRIAPIRDAAGIERIRKEMATRKIYIADGHHRYETALNYRRELIAAGKLKADDREHPANFIYFVNVSMSDPGLIIQPTHRVLKWSAEPGPDTVEELLKSCGTVRETQASGDSLGRLEARIAEPDMAGHIAVYHAGADVAWLWKPDSADPLASIAPTRPPAWRALDIAVLHELLLNRVFTAVSASPDKPQIKYVHQADEAVALCRKEGFQVAFILRPTPLQALRDVTAAKDVMPQKSTYFYPKMLTGLVLNPVEA